MRAIPPATTIDKPYPFATGPMRKERGIGWARARRQHVAAPQPNVDRAQPIGQHG
jgi:hypothetical protein